MNAVRHVTVAARDDGQRLDRWFKAQFPALGFAQLQKLIRTGQVRVDGGRVKPDTRLSAGQSVRVPPLAHGPAPRARRPLSDEDRAFLEGLVLYEDEDLMVLDKPPGLAVQGGTRTVRHLDGLLMGLADEAGERPVLVHRLDRDTSGVLVVARKRTVAARLGRAFQTRAVRKIYWALVAGVPRPAQGTVDLPLIKAGGPDGDRVRPARPGEEGAQRAVTHFAVIDRAGDKIAWVSLKPVTGRQHQLRAHMAAIGTPILGDEKYPTAREIPDAIAPGLHLHARRVTFRHPRDGRVVDVTAPLPPHMAASFAALGFQEKGAPAGEELDAAEA